MLLPLLPGSVHVLADEIRWSRALHKVTIIPRGRALGVTMQLPEADRYSHSKPYLEARIAILMAESVAC